MTALTENINQIVRLTEDEIRAVEKAFGYLELSKGDLWIRQGKICDQVAFVIAGKLRNFYMDDAGNEVTCFFVTADDFISSFTKWLRALG